MTSPVDSFRRWRDLRRLTDDHDQALRINSHLNTQARAHRDCLEKAFRSVLATVLKRDEYIVDLDFDALTVLSISYDPGRTLTAYLRNHGDIPSTGTPRVWVKGSLSILTDQPRFTFCLNIDDVRTAPADVNRGYSTRAVQALLAFARKIHVQYVSGSLSGVDASHLDRLCHFWKKNGFSVSVDPNSQHRMIGGIRLQLAPTPWYK